MADIRKKTRFLKVTSDQSGFDNWRFDGTTFHKEWDAVSQDGLRIAPDEIDVPPPSTKPTGGADISGDPRTNSLTTDIPSESAEVIQYVTAAGGISVSEEPFLLVAGSNVAVNITANPQVSAGYATQIIGIQCIGSAVTLETGSGLSLTAGRPFRMESGSLISLMYDGTDSLWRELSRSVWGGNLGAL